MPLLRVWLMLDGTAWRRRKVEQTVSIAAISKSRTFAFAIILVVDTA